MKCNQCEYIANPSTIKVHKTFIHTDIYNIYLITCKCGLNYVGKCKNLSKRNSEHKSNCYNQRRRHYNYNLYKHIRECCDFNDITMEVLETVETCNSKYLENYYINFYNSIENGLNSLRG